jgi:salicylate hydroxylase
VIGDGIAGLAMTLALAPFGHEVTLISEDRVRHGRHMGGMQLAPNSWAALRQLSCDDDIKAHAKTLEVMRLIALTTGHTLISLPLDMANRRQPYASVTRRGLLAELMTKITALDNVSVIKAKVASVASDLAKAKASISFDDGTIMDADWVFGADGINGVCRRYIQGDQALKPMRSVRQAHRFVIPLCDLPEVMASASTSVWLGREGHIVHYPLSDDHLNLVITTSSVKGGEKQAQQLLHQHPWLSGSGIICDDAVATPLTEWPRCDSWIRGRVIVTGDSAHQMPPHLAQGAGQALVDAASLSQLIASGKSGVLLKDILPFWAGQRMRQIRSVLDAASAAGRIFSPPPPLAMMRDAAVGIGGMAVLPRILDRIWSDQN